MTHKNTLFWHDYETFGIDPRRDRPAQFAGIRTDLELNVIGEPLNIYCKQSIDALPHPEACLITGITPDKVNELGLPEYQFIAAIHQALAQAGTCGVGYNTLRFDDEITRNTLYRNFYDPYEREWRNGNSRWDIIDLVRAVHAFRPESIVWPKDEHGVTRFKLELLTKENGLHHEDAHDALSDVRATIDLARLLKTKQPKLYDHAFSLRNKHTVQAMLQIESGKPLLHVSSKYSAQKNCLALVVPLIHHPTNANGVIVYDLSVDPEPLLSLSAKEIHHRIFTAQSALDESEIRIPLKTIHFNRSPIIAPLSVLRAGDAERLQLDLARCKQHYEKISGDHKVSEKLSQVFSTPFESENIDPDLLIYSGGFFHDNDKKQFAQIRKSTAEQLTNAHYHFQDHRLTEMLFRYRARNFAESLTQDEKKRWQNHCRQRLTDNKGEGFLTLEVYFKKLDSLRQSPSDQGQTATTQALIKNLQRYGEKIENYLNTVL